jgi:hypothetical protein
MSEPSLSHDLVKETPIGPVDVMCRCWEDGSSACPVHFDWEDHYYYEDYPHTLEIDRPVCQNSFKLF